MDHAYAYDREHAEARRLARRHERDFRWSAERRRKQERELGEARLLLATAPFVLVRKTVLTTVVFVLLIGAGWALASTSSALAPWMPLVDVLAVTLLVCVQVAALSSVLRVKARREMARRLVEAHEAKLAHTRYQLSPSLHSFGGGPADVRSRRPLQSA